MKIYILLLLNFILINSIAINPNRKRNLRQEGTEIEYTSSGGVYQLKSESVITQISWSKKDNYKYNYLLGIFEGASDSTFSDAVPIAIIKEKGSFTDVNYIDVTVPKAYKYIRYIPPNTNKTDIAPVKFLGGTSSSGGKDFQVTNLPLVTIRVDNNAFPDKKDTEYNCKVSITYEGKLQVVNEQASMKIRGKSTSMVSDKRPYRIKFSKEQQVLGFSGAYKKWTLIANFYDKALMRNAIAFKVSELMKFEYTPRCHPVDVILNGDYRGNYYLCDQREIAKDRLNIDKLTKSDTSEPNISGGYFLEIDGGGSFYGYQNFKTTKGIMWKVNEPDEDDITSEQVNYIQQRVNKFESEVYSGVFDSLDLDSYAKFFLVEEFCGDPDAVWSSCNFYKKRGDDKFYFGPVWDFDLGFDNDQRLTPTNNKPNWAFTYGASSGTMMDFTKTLVGHKTVIQHIQKTWDSLLSSGFTADAMVEFVEKQKALIEESATLNYEKWDHFVKPKSSSPWGDWGGMGGFGRVSETFDAAVDRLKEYVKNRFTSLGNIIKKNAS